MGWRKGRYHYLPHCRQAPDGPMQLTEEEESKLLKLASIHCTITEMAHCLDFSVTQFRKMLEQSPEIEQKINKAKAGTSSAIRARQLQAALGGHIGMLQFLGRHYLGQKDGQSDLTAQAIEGMNITDITPEARAHLETITKAIYNKREDPIEIEATVTESDQGKEPINTKFIKGSY